MAIRITLDPFCKHLISTLGHPIISTSANLNGSAFPNSYDEIEDQIKEEVDHIVKLRTEQPTKAQPSVIARIDEKGGLHFLRD